jgi:hypothetical protein
MGSLIPLKIGGAGKTLKLTMKGWRLVGSDEGVVLVGEFNRSTWISGI